MVLEFITCSLTLKEKMLIKIAYTKCHNKSFYVNAIKICHDRKFYL